MELFELTVHELQQRLASGEASSQEIVKSIFARINEVENKVKAFITLTEEDALNKAQEVDKAGQYKGIAGIPFGLKDGFCTRGVKTTCASKMLADFVPAYDATASRRLDEQQGILAGKQNMDEFSVGSSTETSALFVTCNPWDLERVPGGSSGGSAAAVAADEVPFSLGTDTGGSIRQPASFCGVVGMKPTYGRVSRWGVIPYASSLDQVGVISKDVYDNALIMKIIAGHDPADSTSADLYVPDYIAGLDGKVKGLRIGYPKEYFGEGVAGPIQESVKRALLKYEELGAIVEEVSLPHSQYALPVYKVVASAEGSANLARFDGVRYGYRDNEAESVDAMFSQTRRQGFGNEVKRRIMLGTCVLSSDYYEAYYLKAMQVRRLIANDFAKVFNDFNIIITPTTPTIAFKLGEQAGELLNMNDMLIAPVNLAGLPGISIPCGFEQGMPIGMQIIGKAFDEATIYKAAYAYEQNTNFHTMKPTLGVK